MEVLGDLVRQLSLLATNFGYPGVFLLSMISNLIIFIPVPYLLLIFFLASFSSMNIVVLSLVSALGAAVGKLVIFAVSRSGRRLVSEKSLKNLEFARMIMEKYGTSAVFLVAATPLPDDIFYVPLGLAEFTVWKFFVSCFLGKFLLTLVVALGGRYSVSWIERLLSPDSLFGVVATVLFIAVSVYATLKVDWEAITMKYFLKGEKKGGDEDKGKDEKDKDEEKGDKP